MSLAWIIPNLLKRVQGFEGSRVQSRLWWDLNPYNNFLVAASEWKPLFQVGKADRIVAPIASRREVLA